jgi:type II secretory ATPase GspE/PulE/Tfp pilus assembly ATPase PilB-like protein
MQTILDEAPKEMLSDLSLIDRTLYCSETRKGDPLFISFQSYARRMKAVAEIQFVPAESFRRKYGESQPKALMEMSDIQGYATNLIRIARDKKASDIHLSYRGSHGVIKFRCLGMLRDYAKIPSARMQSLIGTYYNTLSMSPSTSTFIPGTRQDSRIVSRKFLPEGVHSVRLHSEPLECAETEGEPGTLMLLRLLDDRTEAKGGLKERLTALGYDAIDIAKFQSLVERTGLTIISGPTGHGKSTLLKHLMDSQALQNPQKSYMSIEDPPEYTFESVYQTRVSTNSNEAVDQHKRDLEYINAIYGAMRSDPDVIMIGEIRYAEAAKAAIVAALTGHGAFATLHANHALGIIMRMKALLDEAKVSDPLEYLGNHNVLSGLVYQRLLPVLCPHCKIPFTSFFTASDEEKKHMNKVLPPLTFERLMKTVKDRDQVYILGRGCSECDQLGIVGQTVAAEIIVTDETLLRHVRHGNSDKAYEYWLHEMNGRTYIQHAIEGISQGRLDPYMSELRLGVPLDFVQNSGEKQ